MAAQQPDWRRDLGFTDRIAVTTEITDAYQTANPGCTPKKARDFAKSEEITARNNALTLQEYHELCAKSIRLLIASAPARPPSVDSHANEHWSSNLPEEHAIIGRYTNARHHRDGLFSQVFQAIDNTRMDRAVALKISTPSLMIAPHNSDREIRILQQLQGKPSIIELLEVFKLPGDRLVLVFPFMPVELSTLLVQRRLSPHEQQNIVKDLFTGLAEVHSSGIIHRDIKPSNILLQSASGPAYLADFGIAWQASAPGAESEDTKHLEVGTTCYRPPELLFGGQDYDASLDMWAAGCVVAQITALGKKTLFDAGELGSELALIKSVFETLGTPDIKRWPEASKLPDWGKMNFAQYPQQTWSDILPHASSEARALVASLVEYDRGSRASAREALNSSFLHAASH